MTPSIRHFMFIVLLKFLIDRDKAECELSARKINIPNARLNENIKHYCERLIGHMEKTRSPQCAVAYHTSEHVVHVFQIKGG